MKRPLHPLAACIALAFAAGAALAAGSSTAPPTPTAPAVATAPAAQPGTGTRNAESKKDDKLSHGDRRFVEKAAGGGLFEVQIAQLAQAKASDPNVKNFATMMVDDHTKANNELAQIANAKKVELPAAPPHSDRRKIEKLGKKTGSDFDQAFIDEVGVKGHKKTIRMFAKAAQQLKDADLRAFAQKTLPTLQKHLAEAEKIQTAMKGGSNPASMGSGPMPRGPSAGTPSPKNKGS
ncbi:MAG TPA: DUF4142 domain-containing protein [Ramlibacter sp.]|uniref:DUF4142 domain-containing protein n=1 Tax=Ramlibacter sp. TaxID=1917967 RepID=UPI002D1573FD|nr:DUF4142 domain-containing protein [Ramlibacter sp.]HVZ45885.1 DUF4142 domain-containing protein [Ramlibacter sp.]